MKTLLLIAGVLLFFVLAFLGCRARVRAERWWQCAWCHCYFNEAQEVSNVPPLEPINSHGVCPACREKEIREWQLKKILK